MKVYSAKIGQGETVDSNKINNLQNAILANSGYQTLLRKFQMGESAISLPSAMQTLQSIVSERFFCNKIQYVTLKTQFEAIQAYHFQKLNLLTSSDTRGTPPDLDMATERYKQFCNIIKEEYSMLPLPLDNDYVLLDRQNRVLWTVATVGEAFYYQDAEASASRYSVGPYTGWRLPKHHEAASLGAWAGVKNVGFQVSDNELDHNFFCSPRGGWNFREGRVMPGIFSFGHSVNPV